MGTTPAIWLVVSGRITSTLEGSGVTGRYEGGEVWTTRTLTAISPPVVVEPRTSYDNLVDKNQVTSSRTLNSWHVDPGSSRYEGLSSASLRDKQQSNFQSDGTNQAYHTSGVTNNLSRMAAGRIALPLSAKILGREASVVQSIAVDAANWKLEERPALSQMSVITLLSAPPAVGSLRPGVAALSKVSLLNTSTLNLGLLRNLPAVAGLPSFSSLKARLRGFDGNQHTDNTKSRNIVPLNGQATRDPYGGTIQRLNAEAMLALHYNAYTFDQKRELVILLANYASDYEARAREGGIWGANGGHSNGRQEVIAFIAELFDNVQMRQTCALTVQQSVSTAKVGLSIFASMSALFSVTQTMISTTALMSTSKRFQQAEMGWPEWGDDYSRDPATRYYDIDGGTFSYGYNAGYRSINAASRTPFSLALRLLQGVTPAVPKLYHDNVDRFCGFANHGLYHFNPGITGLPKLTSNKTSPWVLAAHEKNKGMLNVWVP